MILSIFTAIHIILCIVAFALCKRAGEKEWWLFVVLCLVPIIGPLFVVYLYVMQKVRENSTDQLNDSYNELSK